MQPRNVKTHRPSPMSNGGASNFTSGFLTEDVKKQSMVTSPSTVEV